MKIICIFVSSFFCFSALSHPCRTLFQEGAGFQGVRDTVLQQAKARSSHKKNKKPHNSLLVYQAEENQASHRTPSSSGGFKFQHNRKVDSGEAPSTLSKTLFLNFGDDF